MLSLICYDAATISATSNNSNNTNKTVYNVDGFNSSVDSYGFSETGDTLYYKNNYDKGNLYRYDFNNRTYNKITSTGGQVVLVEPKGQKMVYSNSPEYYLYDAGTDTSIKLPYDSSYTLYFDNNGDLFAAAAAEAFELNNQYGYYYSLFQFANNESRFVEKVTQNYNNNANSYSNKVIFDKSGEYIISFTEASYSYYNFIYAFTLNVFRKNNDSWFLTKTINLVDIFKKYYNDTNNYIYGSINNVCFGLDSNTIYFKHNYSTTSYSLDIVTGVLKALDNVGSDFISVYRDGRLNFGNSYLYNPITKEKEFFNVSGVTAADKVWYYPEGNQITFVSNGNVVKYLIDSRNIPEKYLLSFDGKSSWYAYRGGRWILASTENAPTFEEISEAGMTAAEINAIQPVDFDKIYLDGTEVYTINIAIGMASKSIYITPVVKKITVSTISNQPVKCLYSSKIIKYTKTDYNKINGTFPIEDFSKPAESYYILYLGNEWLYTYKNNRLVKLTSSAGDLFSDVNKNWLEIKQYGMSAKELRGIPSDILTKLFINKNFANSEFGFISAIKAYDNSTQGYKIDFRLQADANYFDSNDVGGLVLQIVINGTETKTYLPTDISKDEIDKFMSWLDARQQGKNNIFYRLKTTRKQSFLNYYMITSVNVYDYSEYQKTIANQAASTSNTTAIATSTNTGTPTITSPTTSNETDTQASGTGTSTENTGTSSTTNP